MQLRLYICLPKSTHMFTLRKRKYESAKHYEDLFNRMKLQVEPTAELENSFFGNLSQDTTKPWVGRVESSRGTFEIMRPNPSSLLPLRFLEGNFFTVIVEGHVLRDSNKTHISVSYTLGVKAGVMLLMTYLWPLVAIINFISTGEWESINNFLFFVLVFTLIPSLLLVVQLNHTENIIFDFLGIPAS